MQKEQPQNLYPYNNFLFLKPLRDISCSTYDETVIDITRIAATTFSIPFSSVYLSSSSSEDKRDYAKAVAAIRNEARTKILEKTSKEELLKRKRGGVIVADEGTAVTVQAGATAATIAKKALRTERIEKTSKKKMTQTTNITIPIEVLAIEYIKNNVKPYTLIELRKILFYLGETGPHGSVPQTRSDLLRYICLGLYERV